MIEDELFEQEMEDWLERMLLKGLLLPFGRAVQERRSVERSEEYDEDGKGR